MKPTTDAQRSTGRNQSLSHAAAQRHNEESRPVTLRCAVAPLREKTFSRKREFADLLRRGYAEQDIFPLPALKDLDRLKRFGSILSI